jgi:hypothetical protein
MFAAAQDERNSLQHRNEVWRTLGRAGRVLGEGSSAVQPGTGGAQFNLRIFLGKDRPLVIEGRAQEPIDGEMVEIS